MFRVANGMTGRIIVSDDEQAKFGMVLDDKYTRMLCEIAAFMDESPYEVILGAINTLYGGVTEAKK